MLEDNIQGSFFNAHVLHKSLTKKKKTDVTEVCHVSHSILSFKTKNHAIKVTYTKFFLDAILGS